MREVRHDFPGDHTVVAGGHVARDVAGEGCLREVCDVLAGGRP